MRGITERGKDSASIEPTGERSPKPGKRPVQFSASFSALVTVYEVVAQAGNATDSREEQDRL